MTARNGTLAWLSNETPAVDGSGGQRRQFHQIKALTETGIDVHPILLASSQNDASIKRLTRTTRYTTAPWDRRLLRPSRELKRILTADMPNAAVVAHIESFPSVARLLTSLNLPVAIDFHNVNSRWYDTVGQHQEAELWRARERAALGSTSLATCCSGQERDALRRLLPGARIEVAANGVDPDEWPASALRAEREPVVAVFATWSHAPNRIGLEWFFESVWPAIIHERHDARLVVVGPGSPPSAPNDLPGIHVAGRVADLAGFLGGVQVIAVPIVKGIGARMKFGEALASGAAVVSTSVGAEGADAGARFVTADSGSDFSRACLELLANPRGADELGRRARAWSLRELAWQRTVAPILDWYTRLAGSPGPAVHPDETF